MSFDLLFAYSKQYSLSLRWLHQILMKYSVTLGQRQPSLYQNVRN